MGSPVVIASPRKSPLSGRRINKPLVEKKRRARINGCLGQLKSLILTAMHTEQDAQVSRLEKADILEMTVNYLRQIQRQQVTVAVASEPDVVAKFSAGYTECATEVIRYMDSVKCVAPDVRSRLESHLVDRLRSSVPADSNEGVAPVVYSKANGNSRNDFHSRQSSSIPSITPDQRHNQSAIDLSDMPSSTHLKENCTHPTAVATPRLHNPPQSLVRSIQPKSAISPPKQLQSGLIETICAGNPLKCEPSPRTNPRSERYISNATDIIPTQSTNPPRVIHRESSFGLASYSTSAQDSNDNRQLRECLQTAVLCSTYSPSSRVKSPLVTHKDVNNNGRIKHHLSNITSNINNHHNNFHHPLHIHIPDVPPPATPSPPFLHSQANYPQNHTNSNSPSSPNTTYNYDDGPPTILYGYPDYTMKDQSTPSPLSSEEIAYRRSTSNDQNINPLHFCSNFSTTEPGTNTSCSNSHHQQELQPLFTDRNLEPMDVTHESHTLCQAGRRASFTERTLTHSPPSPENSYNIQTNNNNYSNFSRHIRPNSVHLSTGLTTINHGQISTERQTGRDNHNVSQEFDQLKNSYGQPVSYSLRDNRHLTIPTTIDSSRECLSVPTTTHSVSLNNGLPLPPRASSRQNDTPLSPPTLKKRLLLAQGSEVEWTSLRSGGMNDDKRNHPLDAGLAERGQNRRLWQDVESRAILKQEVHSVGPSVLFCTVRGHTILADDGLWRPW